MANKVAKNDNNCVSDEWTVTFGSIYKSLEDAERIESQESFAIEIDIDKTVLSRILNGHRDMPKKHRARIKKFLEEKYQVIWAFYQLNGDLGFAVGMANENGIYKEKKLEELTNPELITLCRSYEREIMALNRKLAAKDQESNELRQRIDNLQNELLKAKDQLIEALKGKK